MISSMRKIQILFLSLVIFIFCSCGTKYSGWGVLYVDDETNSLTAGTIFPVTQISESRKVCSIELIKSKTVLEIPEWKINVFEKEEDAKQFADQYKEWITIFAKCTLNGLSIREEANINSDRVYKLQKGQELKIIGRIDNAETIANHEGYWYIVLTKDGIKGFCFDKNLIIYNAKESNTSNTKKMDEDLLNQFLEKPFRQTYFLDMINSQSFDLTKFKLNYGIFAYPEEKKVVISTPDHEAVFEYTDISENNNGRFIFDSTSLQIEVRSEDKIAAYYNYQNKEYAEIMIYIANPEEIINEEKNRRASLIDKLKEMKSISSKAYGNIIFSKSDSFTWKNYDLLVPTIIPEGSGKNGSISIRYPVSSKLKVDFDGVLSFNFNNNSSQYINFLFKLSELGVKLEYVPNSNIENNYLMRESETPLIIFMSADGE